MFTTKIDQKEIKVTFQNQKAAHRGQLTRPEVRPIKKPILGEYFANEIVRVPVYAVCYCFFNGVCVGVAFCSYSDEKRYSKETGRCLALKNAFKESVLLRTGKKDHLVAEERAQVWEDYFFMKKGTMNPMLIERGIQRIARRHFQEGLPTNEPVPFPSEKDLNHTSIPWRLGGHSAMNDETIAHLNHEDQNDY